MILRPRQEIFVKKCVENLNAYGNTIGIAATGFGKTVAMSAIVGRVIKNGKCLILAHRDELTNQNSGTFLKMNPGLPLSFYDSRQKSWRGKCVFGMVQTIAREIKEIKNVSPNKTSLPKFDIMVIDECHHLASDSYQSIINEVKKNNPEVKILGVTATPERSDKKGLKSVFNNIADVVTISELVKSGSLVPPVAKVIDIGTQSDLKNVSKTSSDYNMSEVEAIQNTKINNRQIVNAWIEHCIGRVSVAFSSTIQHAVDVRDSFRDAGVESEAVHGNLQKRERDAILKSYDNGNIQMLVNPMILTEGWDCQICSAVLLLRPSSHKSTMIQMVGRGLRKVDPKKHKNVIKNNCIVLDFGISLLLHGDLHSNIRLFDSNQKKEGEAPSKKCPECQCNLPARLRECPICCYIFKVELLEDGCYNEIEELRLIEIDLINNSPFKWVTLFDSGKVMMSVGFESWVCVCTIDNKNYHVIGGNKSVVDTMGVYNKINAISTADDFMRQNETSRNSKKASRWMMDRASDKQLELLARFGVFGVRSKVEAAALITFNFNRRKIERAMGLQ